MNTKIKVSWRSYMVFFLAASFYLYEYVLQVAPSVMAEPMMRTFGVTVQGFGIISACYFYAYAPMQVPAGLFFDRYGPRKLMTIALLLCALGSFFFASATSIYTAAIGRLFIGIGSAFSFIGVLLLASRWFPANYFAVLAGVAQAMSSLGAIFGEAPLAALVSVIGWRQASFLLAFIGLILSVLLWTFIQDYPDKRTQAVTGGKFRDEWRRLLEVWKHSFTWSVGIYAGFIWTPIAVFAVLWGVPYLQAKYQISVVLASTLCTMIWVGIGVGSPLLGFISDKFTSRRLALILSSICGLASTLLLLYCPYISIYNMYFVLFLLGIGAGGQTVSFAVLTDRHPAHLVGTASGFNNFAVLVGATVFQPLVGVILQHTSTHISTDILQYSMLAYQKALSIMPICYTLSLLIVLFFIQESYPGHSRSS